VSSAVVFILLAASNGTGTNVRSADKIGNVRSLQPTPRGPCQKPAGNARSRCVRMNHALQGLWFVGRQERGLH